LAAAEDDRVRVALGKAGRHVGCTKISATRHHVWIALREDDNVAGQHLDRLFSHQPDVAVTCGENVVGNEVLGARQDLRPQLPGVGRLYDPRLRRLDRIEVGAVQSYHPEQI